VKVKGIYIFIFRHISKLSFSSKTVMPQRKKALSSPPVANSSGTSATSSSASSEVSKSTSGQKELLAAVATSSTQMKENCSQSEDLEDKLLESERKWNESWNAFYGKLKERRTHQKQFIKDLDHLFLDQTNNYDVTLTSGEKVFYCHKGILSARSPVFKAMFQSNMKENELGTVEIEDIQQEAFSEFLQYIYTGSISLSFDKYGKELLAVADKYQVDKLKRACKKELISKLDAENCSEMIVMAECNKSMKLKKAAFEFFNKSKE